MAIKIYLYTNLITNSPCYIGQTKKTLQQRAGTNGCKYLVTTYFGPAIQQYGWVNFKGEILTETEDQEYADLLEWFYTIEFNTQWPNGFNCDLGRKHSIEHKEKISISLIGNQRALNHHSPAWNKGMKMDPMSEESKRKQSEAHKGQVAWNKGKRCPQISLAQIGKRATEETKSKMSKSQKGRRWFNNGKINTKAFECPEGFKEGMINGRI